MALFKGIILLTMALLLQCTRHYVDKDLNVFPHSPRSGAVLAYVEFNDTLSKNGWTKLTVITNGSYPDSDQAHAAGVGEGYATAKRILQSWTNTMSGYCAKPSPFCSKLKKFIHHNNHWLQGMIHEHSETSPYWHHMKLIILQLDGLYKGFNLVYPGKLTLEDFYLMNLSGDLEDLEQALGDGQLEKRARKHEKHILGSGSCSALIKWTRKDLLTSQITWNSYQSLIRIIKDYNLNFQFHPEDGSSVPGKQQIFTSYPGYLSSGDDFTLISSGLVSMETTIGNNNASLWQFVKPENSVPEFMRAIVANRLASNGKEWTAVFSDFNSGTYNNQWMIVDYNKFEPSDQQLKSDVLWVLEQIPGHIRAEDQTQVLRDQGYWPSYNTPFYPDIFNISGNQESVEKYGPMFAYDTTPRARIFRRDQHKVVDMATLYKMMRYNDYKNDPLSACECTPPYTAENAIAARSDLNPANGTYLLPFLGHRLHGATDYKGTNHELMSRMSFRAVAGPTSEQQPPFRWSTSDWSNVSHVGMNDLQQFDEVTISFRNRWEESEAF